jgi:cell division protein FtsB
MTATAIKAMREKIGEMTMTNELLEAKIDKLETGHPFRHRRLKT